MGILEHKAGEKIHPVGHRLPTYKECVKHNGRDLGHLEVILIPDTLNSAHYLYPTNPCPPPLPGVDPWVSYDPSIASRFKR